DLLALRAVIVLVGGTALSVAVLRFSPIVGHNVAEAFASTVQAFASAPGPPSAPPPAKAAKPKPSPPEPEVRAAIPVDVPTPEAVPVPKEQTVIVGPHRWSKLVEVPAGRRAFVTFRLNRIEVERNGVSAGSFVREVASGEQVRALSLRGRRPQTV